jgi:ATP-dependent DNA helicase DinG
VAASRDSTEGQSDRPAGHSDRADRPAAHSAPVATDRLLAAAVTAIGGVPREGQQEMAGAVEAALGSGTHLLVQAGTGTGKSLAYLVPAGAHAVAGKKPVVISTATLALQAQIVDGDLPRLADALTPLLGRRPTWQLVKGRRNYLCRYKLAGGFPDEDTLFDTPVDLPEPDPAERALTHPAPSRAGGGSSRLGREVVRLREWAQTTTSGDRDELVPGVTERAWRQVSVSAHECLGSRCPLVAECHVELARERAKSVDVVVTNHAFVAIDSFEGRWMLPEHDVLILDEAHEFADRVTSVITDELTVVGVDSAARRARRIGIGDTGSLEIAGQTLEAVLEGLPSGRLEHGLPEGLQAATVGLRDAARAVITSIQQLGPDKGGDGDGARQVARAAVNEVFDVAERLAADAGQPGGHDVVWVSRT